MVRDHIRIIIVVMVGLFCALMLCVGCTRIEYRDVKIPVPVPCDNEPTDLIPLPAAKWIGHDENWPHEETMKFLDDVAATLIILKAQRANFKERLDACR